MTLRLDYIPLAGGLDESSGMTAPKAGRLIGCENFEIVFGEPGYRRIDGYERLDGRPAPSVATYWRLPFANGTGTISVGDTVDGPSGSGYVLRAQVDSGAWGVDAAGVLILTAVTGTFADTEALDVSSVQQAEASGPATQAAVGVSDYATDIVLARDYYRALIAKPAGEGVILGLAIYNDVVYCLRNDVGGGTATLWASSVGGWTAVRTGMRPSGTLRSVRAGFTGVAGESALYGTDGKNRPWQLKGSTFTFLPAIYATEITSSTLLTPGLGSKTFNFSETSRAWSGGQEVIAYSASNAANWMIGTVTSSTSSSVTVDVTSFGGVAASDWHLCRNDGVDRPYGVAAHKNHLFLSYPKGQLQHSNLGDPMTYTSTAGVIALGDEIVDTKTLRADVLCITQRDTVSLLYGSGKTTWELKQHSESSGARSGSTLEVGGNAIFLNDAGIMSLSGSQAFGDFDAANLCQDALRTLRRVMADYRCASLVKTDSQYRIYGANKTVLVMTWFSGQVTTQSVAFMRLTYDHQPVCSAWDTIDGEEYILFGTDDGWVMRERVGTTFDGEPITAFLRTSYWHNGSQQQKKRMRKLTIDCDSDEAVDVHFKLDFDFAGPDYASTIDFQTQASGGFYDVDYWDEFFWSSPDTAQLEANVDGVGRYMSLLLWSSGDTQSYRVYGMAEQYSPLEIKR